MLPLYKKKVNRSNGVLMNQTNEKQNLDISNAKASFAMNRKDLSLGSSRLVIITEVH